MRLSAERGDPSLERSSHFPRQAMMQSRELELLKQLSASAPPQLDDKQLPTLADFAGADDELVLKLQHRRDRNDMLAQRRSPFRQKVMRVLFRLVPDWVEEGFDVPFDLPEAGPSQTPGQVPQWCQQPQCASPGLGPLLGCLRCKATVCAQCAPRHHLEHLPQDERQSVESDPAVLEAFEQVYQSCLEELGADPDDEEEEAPTPAPAAPGRAEAALRHARAAGLRGPRPPGPGRPPPAYADPLEPPEAGPGLGRSGLDAEAEAEGGPAGEAGAEQRPRPRAPSRAAQALRQARGAGLQGPTPPRG